MNKNKPIYLNLIIEMANFLYLFDKIVGGLLKRL